MQKQTQSYSNQPKGVKALSIKRGNYEADWIKGDPRLMFES